MSQHDRPTTEQARARLALGAALSIREGHRRKCPPHQRTLSNLKTSINETRRHFKAFSAV